MLGGPKLLRPRMTPSTRDESLGPKRLPTASVDGVHLDDARQLHGLGGGGAGGIASRYTKPASRPL